jgi:hypothetical protein
MEWYRLRMHLRCKDLLVAAGSSDASSLRFGAILLERPQRDECRQALVGTILR